MKVRKFDEFCGLLGSVHKLVQPRGVNGLGDIYTAHLVERLNYCRMHPKSSKCH